MGQQRITRAECAHVAALARLELTDEELERFTGQLDELLDHVAEVEALDVEGLPPTMHSLPMASVLRPDVPGEVLDRDEVLAGAPLAENGQFRVPPVLGEAP
ncbi:MAG: Asp-tRNA(Asn)/Glu-tRNA(Gln) amidotransferase subunit GatC [bacterium]|nr:Asp-tRNA(Asn)/Glu-tRNA(Gln) amidotransferase subunit GatC [bacterium]MDE0215965.1 Asp-tRNA(Asn)/Glu-tRNA(Gln) amidotransferase subunit GatC [bacterium]